MEIASLSDAPNTSLEACIINSLALTIKLVKFSKLTSMFFIRESEVSTFLIYWSICSLTTFIPDNSTDLTGSSEATNIFFPLEILPWRLWSSELISEN